MERLHKRFRCSDGSLDIRRILQNTLGLGSALILFSLILVTCVDVVGRYLFAAPLRGAFEITELLLSALIFAALPLTTERKEHIEVDLINMFFPAKSMRYVTAFAGFFSAALLMTLSWRLAVHALSAAHDGAITNALNIPLAPFGYLASFSCFVSALIAILHALQPAPTYTTGDDHV